MALSRVGLGVSAGVALALVASCTLAEGRIEVHGDDCFVCHAPQYAKAANPSHQGVYPTTCADCHTVDGWVPSRFGRHPEDAFPTTTGPHGSTACFDCHDTSRGAFGQGANTDCVGCHAGTHGRAEMDALHEARAVSGYDFGADAAPNFCLSCHPRGLVDGGLHPEESFPIASGSHAELGCSSCHDAALGSPADGANTNCVECHLGTHPRSAMDEAHAGFAGYPTGPADPNFCLSCHPRGEGGAGHPESEFPIATGNHSVECSSCHDSALGSPAGGANTDCIGCHLGAHPRSTMDDLHGGLTGYPAGSAEPSFCLSCHPRGEAAGTPHPETDFPITSGAHNGLWCTDCHDEARGGRTDGANTDCIDCHMGAHPRSTMDVVHAGLSGYPTGPADPNFCLLCHPDGTRG